MVERWTEMNLIPAVPRHPIDLAIELLRPLIHDTLSGYWEAWFYSMYTDDDPDHPDMLRLRILWQASKRDAGSEKLTEFLNAHEVRAKLYDCYEGSHGERNQVYPGEADKFGSDMWPVTYKNWMSGSEMALTILNLLAQRASFKMPPEVHWAYRVHMFSNALGLEYKGEAELSLMRARDYLEPRSDDRSKAIVKAIKKYFEEEPRPAP
jgi:hypothetical protein